jgi:hypothetical protein
MYAQKLETLPPPPGVIGSLKAGFDVVSNHVALILLPLIVDLALWLGPRLSVSEVLSPIYRSVFAQIQRGLASQQDAQQLVAFQELFNEGLQRFNLFSLVSRLQTFPIGISSLLAKTMPVETPLGAKDITQVGSPLSLIGTLFLIVLVGWVIGGLYFRWVSGKALGARGAAISISQAIFQTLLLSVAWFIFLMVLSIPLMLLLTVLTFINPMLASIALFGLVLVSFWLIVPLFFIPHGIFVRRENAFSSIFSSFRMARFTLPTSAMFVFTTFILSTGLNYLWSVPDGNSWMALIGIAGHAFIATALLAASFVYYHDMTSWLQIVIEKLQQKDNPPARQA